jgi:hypothetical protein
MEVTTVTQILHDPMPADEQAITPTRWAPR